MGACQCYYPRFREQERVSSYTWEYWEAPLVPFLISSNLVLSFLFSRNKILTKKSSPTIDLSLIFLSYLNLLSMLLKKALLRISLQIISSTHINLRTPSIILLSLLFLLFTTTSLSLWVNKSYCFMYPWSLCCLRYYIDHSILLHRLSTWFGFDGTVISWLTSYLSSRSFVVSINSTSSAHFPLRQGVQGSVLVLSYSYSTLFLSVLLSLTRLSVIIYLLRTLNSSSPSGRLNSLSICYTYKIQLILSLKSCLHIYSQSI